ncbi:Mediator complex protein [Gracilaria domingensis]|nr:Mediator complex protein [Gracilaria domingensis]
MVGQQQSLTTAESLRRLNAAEQKVLNFLTQATEAVRALSQTEAPEVTSASVHAQQFIVNVHEVQAILRSQIESLTSDVPQENTTMLRLVEADLALQRTAHVHRALAHILRAFGEPVSGVPTTAPSPPYMPSPVANTPVGLIGGMAPTPPAGGAPITIAVPSPDSKAANAQLSMQIGLNGGTSEPAEAQNTDAMEM